MIMHRLLEIIDVNLIVPVNACAVDHLERIDRVPLEGVVGSNVLCVLNMLGPSQEQRVCVRASDDESEVDSLFSLDSGIEPMGRETFDLLGIIFTDHPDLMRIVMKVDWKGHALRQDYSVGHVPIQFKESPGPR